MPNGVNNTLDIANLKKRDRKLVLKQSGFSSGSSWCEGVVFLHKVSHKTIEEKLERACSDNEHLYIIQDFKEGRQQTMEYIDNEGTVATMNAKIRITPYYSYLGASKGELIAAKVTGCENTEYIHGTTASINTAVVRKEGSER